jgi:hypothetical protein
VHGATEAPYWPILACDTRVRVKTRYFEKFKINISTGRIQTKFSTRNTGCIKKKVIELQRAIVSDLLCV